MIQSKNGIIELQFLPPLQWRMGCIIYNLGGEERPLGIGATSPKDLRHLSRGTQERAHLSWVRGATSHSSRLRLKSHAPPLTLQSLDSKEGSHLESCAQVSHLESCAQVREANPSLLETSPNKLGWDTKCPLSWVLTQQNQKRTNCLFQLTKNMFPKISMCWFWVNYLIK